MCESYILGVLCVYFILGFYLFTCLFVCLFVWERSGAHISDDRLSEMVHSCLESQGCAYRRPQLRCRQPTAVHIRIPRHPNAAHYRRHTALKIFCSITKPACSGGLLFRIPRFFYAFLPWKVELPWKRHEGIRYPHGCKSPWCSDGRVPEPPAQPGRPRRSGASG